MQKKRILAVGVALLVLAAVMVGVFLLSRPHTEEGSKAFTLEVVHKDGSVKTFAYKTDDEYLGPFLTGKGLISAAPNGVYDKVDGETADWAADNAYWGFSINGEYAMVGLDDAPIRDGDVFRLEYTVSTGEW